MCNELIKKFFLEKATPYKLEILRNNNIPLLIVKTNNSIYFSSYPPIKLNVLKGEHLCPNCKHMLACKKEDGGCIKVLERRKKIEKYHFIEEGYEYYNTKSECFIVIKCFDFEKDKV